MLVKFRGCWGAFATAWCRLAKAVTSQKTCFFVDGCSRDRLLCILAVVYAAGLLACTHWPRVTVPGVDVGGLPLDKAAHLALYLGLSLLVIGACGFRRGGCWQGVAGCFLGILVFAAVDEVTQAWVGRMPEVLDWMADGVGAAAGVLGFYWHYQWRRSRADAQ